MSIGGPVASTLLAALSIVPLAFAQPTDTRLPSLTAPGLPSNGLSPSGISLGFLPNWSQEGPRAINRALGRSISVIGDYINVSPTDYSFAQVDYHLDEVVRVANGDVKAVYAPAVLFSSRLEDWSPAMSSALAQAMRKVNQRGVTVWLRWCFEMNGSWMAYGLQPDLYASTWRSVTDAVRAATNETYMLWSPNLWNGQVDDATQGYVPYWPGQDYVDVAGLSFYSFGDNKAFNQAPSSDLFRTGFTPFYNLLSPSSASSSSNLLNLTAAFPIVVSETSAPYYYTISTSSPYYRQTFDTDIATPLPNVSTYSPSLASPPHPRSDDELFQKASWIVQLTSNTTAARFPNLRCVSWFNYLKKGEAQVLSDFRFVGGNSTVEAWIRTNFGNQTAYEEGYTGRASSTRRTGVGAFALLSLVVACAEQKRRAGRLLTQSMAYPHAQTGIPYGPSYESLSPGASSPGSSRLQSSFSDVGAAGSGGLYGRTADGGDGGYGGGLKSSETALYIGGTGRSDPKEPSAFRTKRIILMIVCGCVIVAIIALAVLGIQGKV
ncbi:hypothetical protein JCM1840_001414 [Sporobolomyces johnsonii]